MIRQLTLDEVELYIKDDTVRPHLSAEFRTSQNRQVWGLFEDQYTTQDQPSTAPLAVTCIAYAHGAPENESELDLFSLTDGIGTIDPPAHDPETRYANGWETLEQAMESCSESQDTVLTLYDNGTIINTLGEPMEFDSEGNLAPKRRPFMIQAEQNVVVYYTIWSYDPGAGARLLRELGEWVWNNRKEVWYWVTLSPLTEMAERFHLSNGAELFAKYPENQTFEYTKQFMDYDARMNELQGITNDNPQLLAED